MPDFWSLFVLLFTIFIIVVAQKLVLQQSKNVTAKCTEPLSPPPSIQYLIGGAQEPRCNCWRTPPIWVSEASFAREICAVGSGWWELVVKWVHSWPLQKQNPSLRTIGKMMEKLGCPIDKLPVKIYQSDESLKLLNVLGWGDWRMASKWWGGYHQQKHGFQIMLFLRHQTHTYQCSQSNQPPATSQEQDANDAGGYWDLCWHSVDHPDRWMWKEDLNRLCQSVSEKCWQHFSGGRASSKIQRGQMV